MSYRRRLACSPLCLELDSNAESATRMVSLGLSGETLQELFPCHSWVFHQNSYRWEHVQCVQLCWEHLKVHSSQTERRVISWTKEACTIIHCLQVSLLASSKTSVSVKTMLTGIGSPIHQIQVVGVHVQLPCFAEGLVPFPYSLLKLSQYIVYNYKVLAS